MELLKLALAFLKIGAASFGGGWTIVGVIRAETVGSGWLDDAAFSSLVATAQITPGPIALNAATLVGWNVAGLAGAVVATLSVIAIPVAAMAFMLALSRRRADGRDPWGEALKSGTLALMVLTFWNFAPSAAASPATAIIALAAFALSAATKTPPLAIILAAGAISLVLGLLVPGSR